MTSVGGAFCWEVVRVPGCWRGCAQSSGGASSSRSAWHPVCGDEQRRAPRNPLSTGSGSSRSWCVYKDEAMAGEMCGEPLDASLAFSRPSKKVEKKITDVDIFIIRFFLICSEKIFFFSLNHCAGKFPQQAFPRLVCPRTMVIFLCQLWAALGRGWSQKWAFLARPMGLQDIQSHLGISNYYYWNHCKHLNKCLLTLGKV